VVGDVGEEGPDVGEEGPDGSVDAGIGASCDGVAASLVLEDSLMLEMVERLVGDEASVDGLDERAPPTAFGPRVAAVVVVQPTATAATRMTGNIHVPGSLCVRRLYPPRGW
jgi:hypothetical protein